MKGLLLDQGLPRSAAKFLRARGRAALHVGEIGMAQASDSAIMEHARKNGLVIVTLDADFHALLALTGASEPSVIRLRAQGVKGAEACELIESVVEKVGRHLEGGVMVSASRNLTRVKRLPIY